MGLFDWLFGRKHKKHQSKGWIKTENIPKWARETLFKIVRRLGDIGYVKGKHYEYKLIVKGDFQACHFNYIFYKRKIRRRYASK